MDGLDDLSLDFPEDAIIEEPKARSFGLDLDELVLMASNTKTDAFDKELPSLEQFLQQIAKLRVKMENQPEGSTYRLLYEALLNNLDHAYVSKDSMAWLTRSGEMTEHQIRIFMSNQRRRSVLTHKPGIQKDIESVAERVMSLDTFIQAYLDEISGKRPTDVLSSPVISLKSTSQ